MFVRMDLMKKLRVQFSKCAGAPDRFHGSGRRIDGKMVRSIRTIKKSMWKKKEKTKILSFLSIKK